MEDRAYTLVTDDDSLTNQGQASPEQLFELHHERVFLAAYRVSGNVQDAEDVLQSVFLKLLSRAPADTVDTAASYLCRAAINASLDILRKRRRLTIVRSRGDVLTTCIPVI